MNGHGRYLAKLPGRVDDTPCFPARVRAAVYFRAGWACERCGRFDALGIYSRRADAGAHPPNAVILCGTCRDWLTCHRRVAYGEGWALLPGHAAGTVPLIPYRIRRPARLTPTGRYLHTTKEIPA